MISKFKGLQRTLILGFNVTGSKRSISSKAQLMKVTEDPNYKGLYFCDYECPEKGYYIELSFNKPTKEAPLEQDQIIGIYHGKLSKYSNLSLNASLFQENKDFFQKMHKVIKKNIAQADANLINYAQYQKEGWIHINDERNPPPFGRIASPEDIIGSVLINKGTILSETYQPMPSHRPFTKLHGLFRLPLCYQMLLCKK